MRDSTGSGPNHEPIVVNDLKKSFGRQTVLNGISLSVPAGKTVTVLGRSGTGKSVLLKLLIGLQRPDSGIIRLEGQEIANLSANDLNTVRKRVGFLFQDAALYDSMSVEDNVAFPLRRHTNLSSAEVLERARALLANVGLEKDLEKMPAEISGGMRKRVGLARALALEPAIVLFDEPTSGLDPITAAEIGELIVKLRRDRDMTSVVVTHDIRGARTFSDRFVVLHQGRIAAEGTFEELERSDDPFVTSYLKAAA